MDAITARQHATAAFLVAQENHAAAVAAYDAADKAGTSALHLLRYEEAVYAAQQAVEAAQAAEAEALCRAYAQGFPTPNVLRAVALCVAGTLAWTDVAVVFARSYAEAQKVTNG